MVELYKKYRPVALDQMLVSGNAVPMLEKFFREGTLPHTILIPGPSGCGKTTLARLIRDHVGG